MNDLSFTDWLTQAKLSRPDLDHAMLQQAYDYAAELSPQAASPYTASTLAQGLKIASLLAEIHADSPTLAAAIAYPGVYYAQPSREKLTQALPPIVTKLIQGVTRMEAVHSVHRESDHLNAEQVNKLRKMLLAIVDDIRIVLIKLAERLVTLEHLKKCNQQQQHYIAQQAMNFYAPLANRLGIGQLKWQLEDLAFRYLNPEAYFSISKLLNKRRVERDLFIQETIAELTTLLNTQGILNFSITGRAKHIYSIYKKAQRKELPVSEIYDILAVRVLVDTIADCYAVLSAVHECWPHIPKEFDDYIANQKPNGYQSIHTVITSDGLNVEIQIRTYAMHEAAEGGVAAHWKYKEGGAEKESYEEKIARLRELINWQKEVTEDTTHLYESLLADRIYVFTPQGDVFDLPSRSTPLDFAYHVHTAIGHRTKGAKVNEKMVPLTHALETGDRVEIITAKEEHPSRDWLNPALGYLKTPEALQKVRHWFKKQHYEKDVAAGLAIFEKAIRHEPGMNKSDLTPLAKQLSIKKPDDLLVALASNQISVHQILQQLKALKDLNPLPSSLNDTIKTKSNRPAKKHNSDLVIEGVGNLLTHIAKCCKPIPSDRIIGFITTGRGVSIHRVDCPNIQHELLTQPHRMMEVTWGIQCEGTYPIDLVILAHDRSGLVRDISSVIAQEKLHFLGLTTQVNRTTQQANIFITIEINPTISIDRLCKQIMQISGVISAQRNFLS